MMKYIIDYIIYLTVKICSLFFCFLPDKLAIWIGICLGNAVYILYPNRLNVAYSNLLMAFKGSKSPRYLKSICRKAYINLVLIIIEILRIPNINEKYKQKYINIKGIENVKKSLDEGKGVIFLTAHFGNWELSAIFAAMEKLPIKVLAREQKPVRVNNMLNSYRRSQGAEVIGKGFQIRQVIKTLRKNQCIGILADQDAGKTGNFVDFFGKPASTPAGPFIFSYNAKAAIFPAFMIRKEGLRHSIEMKNPLIIDRTKGKKKFILDGITQYSKILQKYIRKYPEQWLWFHKRWKSTPPVSVLILSDVKAGHLNQSRAAAYEIKRFFKNEHPEFKFTVKEIEVKFKNGFYKNIFNISANFINSRCCGCMKCLKTFLEKSSYKKLSRVYADIIISCGSSLEGVNVLMKTQCNSKNVIIMKPSAVKLKNFDLAFIPAHDNPAKCSNVVVTQGALNLVNDVAMDKSAETIKKSVFYRKKHERPNISIFIGGGTKDYIFDKNTAKKVINECLEAAERINADLLVTTSRRTPQNVSKFLKEKLKNHPRCGLLILAEENNIKDPVAGMLKLSSYAVVSAESVSMVSESASSGKPVIVFSLKKKNSKYTKHEAFLSNLNKQGCIALTCADNISKLIIDFSKRKKYFKKLNDSLRVFENASRLY